MTWDYWVAVIILFFMVAGIGVSLYEAIKEQVDLDKNAKKRNLQKAAAEYDRLRDEEFRELGWTGKY